MSNLIAWLKTLVPIPLKASYRQWRRKFSKGNKFECHDFLGTRIHVQMVDGKSRGWYGHDWAIEDRMEFKDLLSLSIPKSATVFNIGAHQGVVAILLRRLVVPEGRVVAVELDPINAAACKANFEKNRESKISILNAAIADADGFATYSGGSNNSISKKLQKFALGPKIATNTLDRLIDKHGVPHLVYMDIEGAEGLALRGAENALRIVPVWYIEAHGDALCGSFGTTNKDIIQVFSEKGYDLFVSMNQNNQVCPLTDHGKDLSEMFYLLAVKSETKAMRGPRAS